jgi:hypothetical protein
MTGKHAGKHRSSKDASPAPRQDGEREGTEGTEGMAYEPAVNQTAHQPMPASDQDDNDQASVRQNEEHWRRSHSGQEKRQAPDKPPPSR